MAWSDESIANGFFAVVFGFTGLAAIGWFLIFGGIEQAAVAASASPVDARGFALGITRIICVYPAWKALGHFVRMMTDD